MPVFNRRLNIELICNTSIHNSLDRRNMQYRIVCLHICYNQCSVMMTPYNKVMSDNEKKKCKNLIWKHNWFTFDVIINMESFKKENYKHFLAYRQNKFNFFLTAGASKRPQIDFKASIQFLEIFY